METEIVPKRKPRKSRKAMSVQSSQATERPAIVPGQMTGAEAVAYMQNEGIFGPWGGEKDSVELARELRKKAETRDHAN